VNYLAHLQLARPAPLSWLGALLADFGRDLRGQPLPDEVRAAMAEHRRIDAFTDAHPLVRDCRRRLGSGLHLLRGVALDVYFDHLLARHWDRFTAQPLERFSQDVYRALTELALPLPPRLAAALPRMRAQDWLTRYRDVESVGLALQGVAHRLRRPGALDHGLATLLAQGRAIEQAFLDFYPELLEFVRAPREVGAARAREVP
jgi:acyl carrier protein phosphodiesterase